MKESSIQQMSSDYLKIQLRVHVGYSYWGTREITFEFSTTTVTEVKICCHDNFVEWLVI